LLLNSFLIETEYILYTFWVSDFFLHRVDNGGTQQVSNSYNEEAIKALGLGVGP
jgi:hypothetical protein